jgi:hypothetical protein
VCRLLHEIRSKIKSHQTQTHNAQQQRFSIVQYWCVYSFRRHNNYRCHQIIYLFIVHCNVYFCLSLRIGWPGEKC